MENPFRGLRFSLLDFHSARANVGMKLAMAAIAIIPLVYGVLYLMAFYDPYGKLDTLPVAVVNEDQGATLSDGSTIHAGEDLVARLRDSKSLDYSFVDDGTAQRGIEDGTYYLKVVIPQDFSQNIASADGSEPTQAKLVFVANEANNYLSSILGKSVFREVTAQTNYAVGDNYYVQIFDKINASGRDIRRAADGAFDLEDGLGQISDGAATLAQGAGTARDGASALAAGVGSAQAGSQRITTNLNTAAQGARALADGTDAAAAGAQTLASGTAAAANGATQLSGGMTTLMDGLGREFQGSKELASKLSLLQRQGTGQVAQGAQALQAQLMAQRDTISKLGPGAQQVSDGVSELSDTLGGLQDQVSSLDSTTTDLQHQMGELEEGPGKSLTQSGKSLQSHAQAAHDDAAALTKGMAGASSDLSSAGTQAGDAAKSAGAAAQALSQISPQQSKDGTNTYTITATEYQALQSAQKSAASASDSAKRSAASVRSAGDKMKALSSSSLSQDLESLKKDLEGIQQSSTSLVDGASKLLKSSKQAISGAQKLVSGLSDKKDDLKKLTDGAQEVAKGATTVTQQLTQATDGTGAPTIYGGIVRLSQGATQVDNNMRAAVGGAEELSMGARQLSDGAQSAKGGATTLAEALGLLNRGSNTLAAGLGSARPGAHTLADGLGLLSRGSATLTSGLGTAADGATSLAKGAAALSDGATTLAGATDTAYDGSKTLADSLESGAATVADQTAHADERASMMSQPVALATDNYTTVANYGTGFAPYFIALGLWVGALVMTFILKPLNRRLICSGANPVVAAFSGLVPWLIVGIIQSIILGLVVQFPLQLDIIHVAAFYLLIILASAVFCAMIQMITAVLGFPGKFVAVILLMLQLTSAAGTFPIQTEPSVFQAISPYMPMTYVVHALRIATRGIDLSLVTGDVAILLLFGGISFLITCLAARRRRLVTMNDLHPLVDL